MERVGEWLSGWKFLNPDGEAGLDERVEAAVARVDELYRRMDDLERNGSVSGGKANGH